jgi:L-ascorbate metabolism protein UlaG (beta-lactamase superfamily)
VHTFSSLIIPANSIGIHWFEQNSYALKEPGGCVVLIDPYFPHDRPQQKFIHPNPPLDESELSTNYVLLTHSHGDHTNSETLDRIYKSWSEAVYIGPRESIEKILHETGIPADRTVIIKAGQSVEIATMAVHALYSKPPKGDPASGIAPPDVTHLGYVIVAGPVRLYVSGDSINTFVRHDEIIDSIRSLKPEIGLLTTHPTEGEFPSFQDSVRIAQLIGLKTVVPSHYDCFVRRTYDPRQWAALFSTDGPQPLIIPRNSHIIYTAEDSTG